MVKYNFLEEKKTMVITTKNIINQIKDITFVSHDDEDGMWEFLDGDEVDETNAAIVSLFEIVQLDNSINELYELPLGGLAYRNNKNEKWIIQID